MTLRFDRDGRDWPHRDASRFVNLGRLRWHVQTMGEGPVVLLLHGTGAATHSWRGVMPLLAEHFTVIAMDLPGHGFTTGRPAGGLAMPAMARAVADLLTALQVQPVAVIGHSAGAAIGVRLAIDGWVAPRAVIGLNAALLPFPGLAARIFPTLAKLLFANPFAPYIFSRIAQGPGEVARFLLRSTGSTIDAEGVALYTRLFSDPGHCGAAIAMMAEWDLEAFAARLPALSVPLNLLHGDRDAAIPARTMAEVAAMVPGTRTELLDGLGHLAHEEAPARVVERIRVALADVTISATE